ncbi:hypothetical protein BDF20DRAFT_808512, partial [Mycotypha africana]|uniref:uncharacterized protein n=1 Tax=Mycotypha africana TaxID=64632 RepID=UPI002301E09E
IDGISPIQPLPALIAGKTQQTMSRGDNGRGRQRSMDIKGLILELIEEIYPPLYCPECYEISSSRSEADNHVKTYHQGSKIFACVSPACKQSYSSRAGLRYHLEHGHTVT